MDTVAYPRLIRRVRAALIDSVLILLGFFAGVAAVGLSGVEQPYAKLVFLLVPVLILEPVLVAFTGGTVGHHLMKIRVGKAGGAGNINLFAAMLRFVVKLLLGWLSFVFILVTRRHQAVHDLVAGSRVVLKTTDALPAYEVLAERMDDSEHYVYPPRWRRVLIIFGYVLLSLFAVEIIAAMFMSRSCLDAHRCSNVDAIVSVILDVLWLVCFGWLVVQGWNGRLYGCRRRRREPAS